MEGYELSGRMEGFELSGRMEGYELSGWSKCVTNLEIGEFPRFLRDGNLGIEECQRVAGPRHNFQTYQ